MTSAKGQARYARALAVAAPRLPRLNAPGQRLRHGLVIVVVDSGCRGDNREAPEFGPDDLG